MADLQKNTTPRSGNYSQANWSKVQQSYQMPRGQFGAIMKDAADMKAMLKSAGWKIAEGEILSRIEKITSLTMENRLRTIQETTTDKDGTQRTYTTTYEMQIAENAGMYKMLHDLLDTFSKIANADTELREKINRGEITVIDGSFEYKPKAIFKVPKVIQKIIDTIKGGEKRGSNH